MKKNFAFIMTLLCSQCLIGQNVIQKKEEASRDRKTLLEKGLEETRVESEEEKLILNEEALILEYENYRTNDFQYGVKIIQQSSLDSMNAIAIRAEQLPSESFTQEYILFKQSGFSEEGYSHLKKAATKTSNQAELYTDFIAAAHILNKQKDFDEYGLKLRNSGFISQETLDYNKNVLRSIDESKAFLVTNGWDDTYPLLTLLKEEKKKNIRVINVEWLYDQNYRQLISKELGQTGVDFHNDPYSWIKQASKKTVEQVYFSPTLPNKELVKLADQVAPIGILFKKGTLSAEVQKYECLKSWKKFSKVGMINSNGLSKNYIVLLSLLEQLLQNDEKERETLKQVLKYKSELEEKHPSLK